MRKLALLLNSLLLGLTVYHWFYLWFYVLTSPYKPSLTDAGMLMLITPFLLFSLFNLIAIYKCKQIYKGRKIIRTLAIVFTLIIIFISIYIFYSEINSQKDYIYALVEAGIISVLPVLNLFVINKCK